MRPTKFIGVLLATIVAGSLAGAPASAAAPTVVQVAASAHALVLLSDGSVVGWGRDSSGQLGGTPPSTTRAWERSPVSVALPGKAVQVAVGDETSYAVLNDGSVWAWGAGGDGQLGIGQAGLDLRVPSENRGTAEPQRVVGADTVKQVVATGLAGFALRADGTVVGWGRSSAGLLGKDYAPTSYGEQGPLVPTPLPIPGLSGITKVSITGSHGLALTGSGQVLAWGSNSRGQLGQGNLGGAQPSPVPVSGLADVIDVAAGGETSAAVTRDGAVWVWGSNQDGHLAKGTTSDKGDPEGDSGTPKRIPGITKAVRVQIGLAGRHTMVQQKDGSMRGWGNSDWGQIGAGVSGRPQPTVQVPKITKVSAFWAVGNNTFAVRTDGTFWIWGSDFDGIGVLAKNQKVPARFDPGPAKPA